MKRALVLPVVAAVAMALVLTGCAPETSSSPSTEAPSAAAPSSSPSAIEGALPPTFVAPDALEGTDVKVVQGTALVLTVPDASEAEWTGTTADVAIAEFSPGGPSEGAVFRPGFLVREVGSTAATLTGADGKTISFTITVVPY
ncbi:hypothetical protein [uncultured Microbacterium sp.]|uniref:hypothetical protein n=1 Tax=uncultured Microbacterium sp. TaxID=191216 RepID=UPI0025F748F3|nr:hypothetical protein [uncultured Microbacterium sp.]